MSVDNDLILAALARLEDKADTSTAVQATLLERVSNMNDKVDVHLAKDEQVHQALRADIDKLKSFNTGLKARIGIYSAIAGAFLAGAIELLKSLLTGGPPAHH